jgi:hypothetical protein
MSSYVRVGLRVAMFFVLAGAATSMVKPRPTHTFDQKCTFCVLDCLRAGGPDPGFDSCADECVAEGLCP